MNNYALIQVVNGNFSVVSEHGDNLQAARVAFHNRCMILWNATDVVTAKVAIMDSNMTFVDGRVEEISHDVEAPVESEE